MDSEYIKRYRLEVEIQDNGIIRDPFGWIVGRCDNEWFNTVVRHELPEKPERTCKMEAAGGLKYKHGGTGSEAKKLFGTEWRTMEKSKCTACHKVTMHDDTIAYSCCPHCGAKVVE